MTSLNSSTCSEGNTFPKEERLSSKKHIEELFKKGSSNHLYPYRLFFSGKLPADQTFPQILVSVPKRNFKKAVDRNRIRRQVKEAYRLNKKAIFSEIGPEFIPSQLAILYIAKEKIPFKKLEEKLILILKRLKNI